MRNYFILTYQNTQELIKYQSEIQKDIHNFIFGETKDLLEEDPDSVIDITALTLLVNINVDNRYYANANLNALTEESTVIIEAAYVDIALRLFPYFFTDSKPIYPKVDEVKIIETNAMQRRDIYVYKNEVVLRELIDYCNEKNIPIASFPIASGLLKANFEEYNKSLTIAIIDFTTTLLAIEDNKNIIYLAEQFLGLLPNISIIIKSSLADQILKYFPLNFISIKPIDVLLSDFVVNNDEEDLYNKHCITDLNDHEFRLFCEYMDINLIGHNIFKENLNRALSNFRSLNRGGEQKVFSMFLFGKSGIGKTEVARVFHDYLGKDTYFAKINFANYSSQDALNSLIGSPAGYIGCNNGELSEKVGKNKIGLILCDEFEKTTRPVFSFFLELLEDGKFTDSMAREYDVNGFIIIFTSNIISDSDYKRIIPQELQTRFDLVCEFEEPSAVDKKLFLELLLSKAETKFSDLFEKNPLSKAEKEELFNFDYQSTSALRDIRREFNYRLMEHFNTKK